MLRKIGVSAVTSDWPEKINDHISDISTDDSTSGKVTDDSTNGKAVN